MLMRPTAQMKGIFDGLLTGLILSLSVWSVLVGMSVCVGTVGQSGED